MNASAQALRALLMHGIPKWGSNSANLYVSTGNIGCLASMAGHGPMMLFASLLGSKLAAVAGVCESVSAPESRRGLDVSTLAGAAFQILIEQRLHIFRTPWNPTPYTSGGISMLRLWSWSTATPKRVCGASLGTSPRRV